MQSLMQRPAIECEYQFGQTEQCFRGRFLNSALIEKMFEGPETFVNDSHSIAFHSVVTTTNKLMAWPWVLKWDPATPIFLQVLSNINFLTNTTAQNLNSTVATLTIASINTPLKKTIGRLGRRVNFRRMGLRIFLSKCCFMASTSLKKLQRAQFRRQP